MLFLTALLLLLCLPVSAEPANAEKISLVTAVEDIPDAVYYYKGKTKADPAAFDWVEGRNGGTALQLNGENQYLRLATAQTSDLDSFTFSTWISWKGNESDDHADAQKLLTLYRNESHYLTVSLHMKDEDRRADGIYMTWQDPNMETVTLFSPTDGNNSFAFPENEWHHVAVVASDTAFSLYIDGVRYLHADVDVNFAGMDLRTFKIGAGFENEPYLNAMLQSTAIYTAELDSNQILLLAQDADPLSGAAATTTTGVLATRPTTTPQEEKRSEDGFSGRIFGLPAGLVIMLAAILLTVITLSVVFSIQRNRRERNGGDSV
jgi:hypothetical protein